MSTMAMASIMPVTAAAAAVCAIGQSSGARCNPVWLLTRSHQDSCSGGRWETRLAKNLDRGRIGLCEQSSSSKSRMRRKRRGELGAGACRAALTKLAEAEPVDLGAPGEVPAGAGVYAVYDKQGKLQFVGISRKVAASLQTHVREVPELCGSARVGVVEGGDRAALTEAWRQWLQEHVDATGEAPPGNVSGDTTWTAKRARVAKPELKLTPGPHKELMVPLTELIDKVVKDLPVVAFIKGTRTAPQCGFSHRVLTVLNENRVDYEVVNVLDDHFNPGLREAIKSYSKWPTIPQLYVNGEFVGGADIVNEMAESGEIAALFKR